MMNKFEGRVLKLDSMDICSRKFAKDCNIRFLERVPVLYNFQNNDPESVLGFADISKDDEGLLCKCELDVAFSDEWYFVGGYYLSVKAHTEGVITVIDSGKLIAMSIVPNGAQADDNLKIRRVNNDQTRKN